MNYQFFFMFLIGSEDDFKFGDLVIADGFICFWKQVDVSPNAELM